MTLAIVHDYLTEFGGAERVVETLLEVYGDAPLYTSVLDPGAVGKGFPVSRVRTSRMQRLVRGKLGTKLLFPLLPAAFRRLDLEGFDVVLTSSSGFAHHVRPRPGAVHVCYCYTPPRFLWQPEVYFRNRRALARLLAPALAAMRRADRRAAAGVDVYLAISNVVARRIRETYGRDAEVVYPPVDTARFTPTSERSGRFLVVSRLLAYKRIDLAVEAASRRGLPLDVIGDGPERPRLERLAGPTVRLLGRQPDEVVRRSMSTCEALVLPGSEDFGLTPVEVQASGRPPVAFASGGALETIEDGRTGFLFKTQSWDALAEAIGRARSESLSVEQLRASARRFDATVFRARIREVVGRSIARHASRRRPAGEGSLAGTDGRLGSLDGVHGVGRVR